MQKNSLEYKVVKISLILALAGLVVFLALIPVSYSLPIGWAAGAFASIAGYLIGVLLINAIFKNRKTKTLGFWIGWLRFNLNLLFQGGLFIAVIAIDKCANGNSFTGGSMSDMFRPINIFTYIGGVSLILISTLVAQYLSRKEG